MVFMVIKEICGRKYVYEVEGYRDHDDRGKVKHRNKYIGPLIKVYKTSKKTARRIINSIVRQIRNPYNRKNATLTVIYYMIEQLHEDVVGYWKQRIRLWKKPG